MKKLLIIVLSTLWFSTFSQIKDYWKPPDKNDCNVILKKHQVVLGKIIIIPFDSSQQKEFNYCQSDSIRVIYNDSCLITSFLKNGILNGNVLMQIGFYPIPYENIIYETNIQKIKNESGSIDSWNGYYIFFGINEVENLRTKNNRILRLSSSGRGDESSFFYLELENINATYKTTISDFIKNANIVCFKYWYSQF